MAGGANKPVLVLSSHVARGAIGGSVATFALQRMGYPVWFLPTVMLPFHPGHGPSTKIVTPAADYKSTLRDILTSGFAAEIGSIFTGYLGEAGQAEVIAEFVEAVRQINPDLVVLCDPVIGDKGGIYVPDDVVEAQRSLMVPLADIVTPNRYELGFLAGGPSESNAELITAARGLDAESVVVTSAFPMMRGAVGNLAVDARGAMLAEHRAFDQAPHGTGDLFSAVHLGRRLSGQPPETALSAATASTMDILAGSLEAGSDEMLAVAGQDSLLRPRSRVDVRRLA